MMDPIRPCAACGRLHMTEPCPGARGTAHGWAYRLGYDWTWQGEGKSGWTREEAIEQGRRAGGGLHFWIAPCWNNIPPMKTVPADVVDMLLEVAEDYYRDTSGMCADWENPILGACADGAVDGLQHKLNQAWCAWIAEQNFPVTWIDEVAAEIVHPIEAP